MSGSFKVNREKNVSGIASPAAPGPVGLNVLKRDGSVQRFDKNKLVNSISKAGATKQQANLVSDRVVNRLGGFKQTVPSIQLASMVARSLGKVNTTASSQYTSFRDQKARSPLAPTAKGAVFAKRPSVVQPVTLKPAAPVAVMKPTSTLPLGAASKPAPTAAPKPVTVSAAQPPTVTAAPPPTGVSPSATVPLQQLPAVSRIGASNETIPLQKILELVKQQPTSRALSCP